MNAAIGPSPKPIPDHVPAELVIDPSPYLARFNSELDPYGDTKDIFEKAPPIFYSNQLTGFGEVDSAWVVTRLKDIREVYQNTAVFSSVDTNSLVRVTGETFCLLPNNIDPPEHTKYRMFLSPWFSPKAVAEMEARIRAVIDELIDEFAEKGACDVAYDFGRVYPVRVFLDLMGFPQDALDKFLSWEYAILHSRGDMARLQWGMREALAWVRGFIEEVRARPASNLTSYIVHGQIDGRPLTDDEIVGMVVFLWVAGLDTVAATTALMFRRLALQPELQQRLRDDPELVPAAVEEFLRMQPMVNTPRRAKQDHEIDGVPIKKGDWVIIFNSSGNFDPAEFEDPREFSLDRPSNRHLTLGGGPHRCLGSHLARRELRIALTEFLRRIPQFSMKPGASLMAFPGLVATSHVPIVWNDNA